MSNDAAGNQSTTSRLGGSSATTASNTGASATATSTSNAQNNDDRFFMCNGKRIELRDVWAGEFRMLTNIPRTGTSVHRSAAADNAYVVHTTRQMVVVLQIRWNRR
jgi:hypothetical protein